MNLRYIKKGKILRIVPRQKNSLLHALPLPLDKILKKTLSCGNGMKIAAL